MRLITFTGDYIYQFSLHEYYFRKFMAAFMFRKINI